jgi:predicted  nucleic acid-binding Zn-ribbon protein
MPRKHTLSAIYMQMHQLANEKERLQQEISMLQERQRQVFRRMTEIEENLSHLEEECSHYGIPLPQSKVPDMEHHGESKYPFSCMTIDY